MDQTAAAAPPNEKPLRPLWVEFLIFFGIGFGVMLLYWLVSGREANQTRLSHGPIPRGKPLIALGATSPDAQAEPAETGAAPDQPAVAEKEEPPPAAPAPAGETVYEYTSWSTLGGYYYEPNTEADDLEGPAIPGMSTRPKSEIPESVKALNGHSALVSGFMVPLKTRKGAVVRFVLCKTIPACCFGDSIRMNEWIIVDLPEGQSTQYVQDQPVQVFGKLEIGEVLDQGVVLSIYRMKADKVVGPPEL